LPPDGRQTQSPVSKAREFDRSGGREKGSVEPCGQELTIDDKSFHLQPRRQKSSAKAK
jgi:hypothetical protein